MGPVDEFFTQLLSELLQGLRHGFFELEITGEIGKGGGARLLVLRAGKSFRFVVPEDEIRSILRFESGISRIIDSCDRIDSGLVAMGPVNEFFTQLFSELLQGLRHGFFELGITGEIGKGRARLVVLRAGKSFRFVIPENDIRSMLRSELGISRTIDSCDRQK